MRKIAVFAGLILAALVVLQWFFSQPNAQEEALNCDGVQFKGAWFTAQVPDGMRVSQSLPSSTGKGADSVWVRATSGDTAFYAYAPQWGGTAYDIFLGATDRREMNREDTAQGSRVELELKYEEFIGRFEIVQSNGPVSHLTTGYRTKTGELSPQELQQYACFKGSINQFSD